MLFKNPLHQLLLVLLGILVVIPIVYSMSFAKSFELLDKIDEGKLQIQKYDRLSDNKVQELEIMELELNKVIASTTQDSGNFQQKLTNYLLAESDKSNLTLTKIPSTEIQEVDGYVFENASFTLEGGFLDLVGALNRIESGCPIGKVVCVDFKKEFNRKTKQSKLYGTLYIQKITS